MDCDKAKEVKEVNTMDKITKCDPPCEPRSMNGGSWWKLYGFNGPCGCAYLARHTHIKNAGWFK